MTDRQAWQHIKRELQASYGFPHMAMSLCCEIWALGGLSGAQIDRLEAQLRTYRPRANARAPHTPYWWPQGAKGLTARLRVCDCILAQLSQERARKASVKKRATR